MGPKASPVVPEWIVQAAADARDLLGVDGGWHVTVALSDCPGGDEENNGHCHIDTAYLNADIELARDLEEGREGRRIIMHEVMHITHSEIDQIVWQILAGLPKRERKQFKEMYCAAVERLLQRVTRAMSRQITPIDDNG